MLARARSARVRPSTLLTSPFSRALQTAEIAAEELRFAGRPITTQALVPYVNVFDLWTALREYAHDGDLMVVGHNPLLSSLVAWLIGARADSLWLKKSGLVSLDVGMFGPPPRATLTWLLTPRSAGR